MKTYSERVKSVEFKIGALKREQKRKHRILTGTCLMLAVVMVGMVLFMPFRDAPPDVSMYKNSPYYELIQKLNRYDYRGLKYKNNFEKLMSAVELRGGEKLAGDVAVNDAVPMPGNSANWGSPLGGLYGEVQEDQYVEVTDNQVTGVVETDIIKRSQHYIFYLRDLELTVYSIEGEDSRAIGNHKIEPEWNDGGYHSAAEMLLSQDCKMLTVLIDGYDKTVGACTVLVNVDVTDPTAPKTVSTITVSGNYLTARMVDGDLLLMSRYRISNQMNYQDPTTFVPQIGKDGQMHCIDPEGIVSPDTLSTKQYTVICKLDGKTLEEKDSAAILSYSQEIYVSAEHIFAVRGYTHTDDNIQKELSQIVCLSYRGDRLEQKGSVTLEGTVKNQYSMDEFEGILRVVTSTNRVITEVHDNETASERFERNANLYCVSLADFQIKASVKDFAPAGEQAESVRFDGNMAYVCTAEVITLTDPVYFFDLSDLNHITCKDTGTIDGYSSSLVDFGDGLLLGIGFGGNRGLKIELYEQTQTGVESICAYERETNFSSIYKSYLIDRDNQLIGLGINDWNSGQSQYVLLHFDGYRLNELTCVPLTGPLELMRGVLIDGWLYLFGGEFQVVKVF